MSSLLRDIALDLAGIARHPRQWWRELHKMNCPVCGQEISFGGANSERQAHRDAHGTQAWRAALRDAQDGAG